MKTFRANGKLMLTGEYLVLDGAKSLALPTVYGQSLTVEDRRSEKGLNIHWKSLDHSGKVWFEAHMGRSLNVLTSTDDEVAKRLYKWLVVATELNPDFLNNKEIEYDVTTRLEFDPNWGLGSSSTLLSMIADWAQIDAYMLLEQAFKGSGYDIACAKADGPIVFQNVNRQPKWNRVDFKPSFSNQLWFVYLGQKQRSYGEIQRYDKLRFDRARSVYEINGLTEEVLAANSLTQFEHAIGEHEQLMSSILGQLPVKQLRFMDFQGEVKSLGAWGGDFVLATSEVDPTAYFEFKGCPVVLPFDKMVQQG